MDSMKDSFGDNTQSRWDMLKNLIRSVYYYILLDVHYKKITAIIYLYYRMARYLTQKQIDEFRECFSLYDKKKQNKVRPNIIKMKL